MRRWKQDKEITMCTYQPWDRRSGEKMQGHEWQKQVQTWLSGGCPWMGYFHKKLANCQHQSTSPGCKTFPDEPPSPERLLSWKVFEYLFLVNGLTHLQPYLKSYLGLLFCASSFRFLSVPGVRTEFNLFIVKGLFITRFLGKFWHLVFIPLTSRFWGWIRCSLSGALKTNLLAARELLWVVFPALFQDPVWFWDR